MKLEANQASCLTAEACEAKAVAADAASDWVDPGPQATLPTPGPVLSTMAGTSVEKPLWGIQQRKTIKLQLFLNFLMQISFQMPKPSSKTEHACSSQISNSGGCNTWLGSKELFLRG